MALRAVHPFAELACHATLFGVIAYANYVRHDRGKIPVAAGDAPKSAFLTVHTIAIEGAWLGLCVAECGLRVVVGAAPSRLTALAHSGDAFVVALGGVLWCAYYGLVHGEIVATALARGSPDYVRWNHRVHFPTLFVPALCVLVKDPGLLRAHAPSARTAALAAALYGCAYAHHVTRCEARAKNRPYAFMARLDTRARRVAFWGGGVALAVVPATLAAARFVDARARR